MSRMNDRVTLVKPDGRRFENIPAAVSLTNIETDDAELPIETGDHFEHVLANGLVENYVVLDGGFFSGLAGVPDHHQVPVRKESP